MIWFDNHVDCFNPIEIRRIPVLFPIVRPWNTDCWQPAVPEGMTITLTLDDNAVCFRILSIETIKAELRPLFPGEAVISTVRLFKLLPNPHGPRFVPGRIVIGDTNRRMLQVSDVGQS